MSKTAKRPAQRGELTTKEYREVLALVLAELEDLDPREVLDTAQRLGRLKVHITTTLGQASPPMEPTYGLRALRRAREKVTPHD